MILIIHPSHPTKPTVNLYLNGAYFTQCTFFFQEGDVTVDHVPFTQS